MKTAVVCISLLMINHLLHFAGKQKFSMMKENLDTKKLLFCLKPGFNKFNRIFYNLLIQRKQ